MRFILLVIVWLLMIAPCMGSVTTLTLYEREGKTTSNYPLTFGHVFKDGDVTGYVSVTYNGTILTTQCDVKTTYPSGDVKFAVISVVLPSVTSGSTNTLVLNTAASTATTGYMDEAAILATNIEDEIRITNLSGSGYSGSLTADLNAEIDTGDFDYWLRGTVVTEVLVEENLNNSLDASWEVRFYPGTSFGPRISHSIENVNADYRGIVNYSVDIQAGEPSLSRRYTYSSLQHNENSRWRKVIWVGTEPPETELHYDLEYLASTGAVMNYNTALSVPEATISDTYSTWQSTDHDIMGNGNINKYFPGTGGRPDLGILPEWSALYLLTMDNRLREVVVNNGEMASSAPIHYRENDNARSFYRLPVSIDDRPTVWTQDDSNSRASKFGWTEDKLPVAIGLYSHTEHDWTIDVAHQGSFAFLPYLITGEKYFLKEVQYWAAYDLSASDSSSVYGRRGSNGIIDPDPRETRGVAWALRNIGDAAKFSVDGEPEGPYFSEKIENNFDFLYARRDLYDLGALQSRGGVEYLVTGVTGGTSPWMDDFVVTAVCHLIDLGFTNGIADVISWYGEFILNRYLHPDFNHYLGSQYRFPLIDGGGNITTWADASASYDTTSDPSQTSNSTSFPTVTAGMSADDYHLYALGLLAIIDDYHTGTYGATAGATARAWLWSEIHNAALDDLLDSHPKWAFLSRKNRRPYPIILKIQQ